MKIVKNVKSSILFICHPMSSRWTSMKCRKSQIYNWVNGQSNKERIATASEKGMMIAEHSKGEFTVVLLIVWYYCCRRPALHAPMGNPHNETNSLRQWWKGRALQLSGAWRWGLSLPTAQDTDTNTHTHKRSPLVDTHSGQSHGWSDRVAPNTHTATRIHKLHTHIRAVVSVTSAS